MWICSFEIPNLSFSLDFCSFMLSVPALPHCFMTVFYNGLIHDREYFYCQAKDWKWKTMNIWQNLQVKTDVSAALKGK